MSKNKYDPTGRLSEFGAIIAGLALMLIMFVGAANVIMDNLFNMPVPGTLELTESLLVISFFMALGFAQLNRSHIAVELFTSRIKGARKHYLDLIAYLTLLILFTVLAYLAWKFALYSLRIREFQQGPIDFPVYPAKIIGAFGLSIMAFQCFSDLVYCIRKIIRRG